MGSVTVTLKGDDSDLLAALNRIIRKENELGRSAERAGDATKRSMAKSGGAVDEMGGKLDGLISKFHPVAAAAAGIGAALAVALQALKDIDAEVGRVAQKQASATGSMRQLAQLSGGDPNKYRALAEQSREFLAAGGATDLNQAAATIFQLESASINTTANRKIFSELGGVIDDPAGFAKAGRTLQASLGREETGAIPDILSKAFGASGESPAKAPALLEAAARSGAAASNLGISDEELLAAVAISAEKAGSAAEGGVNVNRFLIALGQDPEAARAAREGGFAGAIRNIQGRGLSEMTKFQGVFGKREKAYAGFTQLAAGDLEGLTGRVEDAEGAGLAGMIARSTSGDASSHFARETALAKERADRSMSGVSLRRQFADLADARVDEQLIAQGRHTEVWARRQERESRRSGLGAFLITMADYTMPGASVDADDVSIRQGVEAGVISREEQAAYGMQVQIEQLRMLKAQVDKLNRMSSDRIPHSDRNGTKADIGGGR